MSTADIAFVVQTMIGIKRLRSGNFSRVSFL